MKVLATASVVLAVSMSMPTLAQADKIQISRLTDADQQYIYRGWPADVAECGAEIIEEVRQFGVADMWFVILDEEDMHLQFEGQDGSHQWTCTLEGRHEIGMETGGGTAYDRFTPHAYD